MALSEENVRKLAETLFSRDSMNAPTAAYDSEYQAVFSDFHTEMNGRPGKDGNAVSYADKVRAKELAALNGAAPTAEQAAAINKRVEAAVDGRIKTYQDRFVAAHKKEMIPELGLEDLTQEVTGASTMGLITGALGGGLIGTLMGGLHHMVLSMAVKAEPVQQLLAQAQVYATDNWFSSEGSGEMSWAQAGVQAEEIRTAANLEGLGGNVDAAAASKMASVDDARASALMAEMQKKIVAANGGVAPDANAPKTAQAAEPAPENGVKTPEETQQFSQLATDPSVKGMPRLAAANVEDHSGPMNTPIAQAAQQYIG